VVPIANMIASSGYESAFLWFGLGQGIVVVIVALFLASLSGRICCRSVSATADLGNIEC
jgi:MFS transporter, OFA family, oxalate/formate antiporter